MDELKKNEIEIRVVLDKHESIPNVVRSISIALRLLKKQGVYEGGGATLIRKRRVIGRLLTRTSWTQ